MGYNAFDIPRLTYVETNALIETFNKREKQKQKSAKKMKKPKRS